MWNEAWQHAESALVFSSMFWKQKSTSSLSEGRKRFYFLRNPDENFASKIISTFPGIRRNQKLCSGVMFWNYCNPKQMMSTTNLNWFFFNECKVIIRISNSTTSLDRELWALRIVHWVYNNNTAAMWCYSLVLSITFYNASQHNTATIFIST